MVKLKTTDLTTPIGTDTLILLKYRVLCFSSLPFK